ncbi:Flp pilus assembly protein CpaB [bacterium]|nr:MAG: Flp pilus assembly protein CpaB [bacterium]
MNSRRTTLLIAILLALGTGWLTLNYLSSLQRAAAPQAVPRKVVIAVETIPARATITTAMVRETTRPSTQVEPNAVSDGRSAIGALALIGIPAGTTITGSMIGRPSDVGLTVKLQPGMRAVSIPVDQVKDISGLMQPGDRVDVIAIVPRIGNREPEARTILRGILVLAIGNALETASATPAPGSQSSTTVTLAVTPKQADLLAVADANTALRLALRSPREPLHSEPTEALDLTMPGTAEASSQRTVAAGSPRGANTPGQHTALGLVTVVDGDHVVQAGRSDRGAYAR